MIIRETRRQYENVRYLGFLSIKMGKKYILGLDFFFQLPHGKNVLETWWNSKKKTYIEIADCKTSRS